MANTTLLKNKKWLIIGGAVLAVLIIVLVLVLWVFPGDSAKENKDITFGLKPYASRDEAVQAIEKAGLKLDTNESRTDSDDEYRLVCYSNVTLYGIEASRLLIEKDAGERVQIGYDFADYDADMPGCHHIQDAKACHEKVYNRIVENLGNPADGSTAYIANDFRTWRKDGIEYELSDYHGDGKKGQFYFWFRLR